MKYNLRHVILFYIRPSLPLHSQNRDNALGCERKVQSEITELGLVLIITMLKVRAT